MITKFEWITVLSLISACSLAGTVAYEGFDYANRDGLPAKKAGGTGWTNEGWKNFYTDGGVRSRYGIATDFSIQVPSGYGRPMTGGVLQSTYAKDNTVVYRRLAEAVNLGDRNVQYFSLLKKNSYTMASTVALLTEDKKLIFKMEDRVSKSTRIVSDFGDNMFLARDNPAEVDGDSLLVFRLVTDGAGGGTMELVVFQSGMGAVPPAEPESWMLIMTLENLNGKTLGGVGIGILTPNDGSELYDEIRLGGSYSSVLF